MHAPFTLFYASLFSNEWQQSNIFMFSIVSVAKKSRARVKCPFLTRQQVGQKIDTSN